MGSTGVRAPVGTASSMGQWKRLIKIPCGTNCYYCINNRSFPRHVYYYSVVLITIPDILSTIVSLLYLVTLYIICYTSCSDTSFMYTYALHSMYSVSLYPVNPVTV